MQWSFFLTRAIFPAIVPSSRSECYFRIAVDTSLCVTTPPLRCPASLSPCVGCWGKTMMMRAMATVEWWTELGGGRMWQRRLAQSHPTLLAAVRRRVVCDSHVMNVRRTTFLLLRPRCRRRRYVVANSEMRARFSCLETSAIVLLRLWHNVQNGPNMRSI